MTPVWRRPRAWCVLALAAGVALGATARDVPPPAPAIVAGYIVLAADFHVHTSPDGIPPWDAVREARRRRLDVIALTSHNSLRGWRLWQQSPVHETGVLVLPGEELTSVGYHMAIVGLEEPISWRLRAAEAAAAAHAQHAVAILAHPSGGAFRRIITADDLRAVDGVEVAHPQKETSGDAPRDFAEVYRRASSFKPVAAIGSSDFHYFAPIGVCRTYVFVREATAAGVLEAIRSARTVACDARGRTTGPAPFAAAVADRCRADALAPPDGDTAAAQVGTVLAWCALAALVLLGPG